MEITTTSYKRCDVVKLVGRLDSDTVSEAEAALKSLTQAGRHKIVLDMSQVTFVSSKGWWLLIDVQKACKHLPGGEVVLASLDERIQRSLNLVAMGSYFKIFGDVAAAVGSF
ncbi:MAG TPA: STAS domain-containing protein [Anaerolineales bacterium]